MDPHQESLEKEKATSLSLLEAMNVTIMTFKIVRLQKFIYQNIMSLIKSKKMSLITHIIVKRHVYLLIKI